MSEKMPAKIDEKTLDKAREMLKTGKTIRHVANALGIAPATISRHVTRTQMHPYNKKRAVKIDVMEMPTTSRMFLISGSPNDLANFARAFS